MIIAAGLLVLLGLGLFVGGVLTGVTTFYWACVGACVVAAGFLLVARRQMGAPGVPALPPAPTPPAAAEDVASVPTATSAGPATPPVPADAGEPPVEDVEVTDLLLVVDLRDEVLVVDEHPRYHVEGCRHVTGRETIPIPLDEARTDGFTPCGACRPDATLADRVRARR